jgi:hypothetical protein
MGLGHDSTWTWGNNCTSCALQEMRTFLEAEAAGKAVGFELIDSRDIAHTSPPAGHW